MLALLLSAAGASAQLKFVDAEQLGLVNKLGPTENRYHRVDTDKYDLTQAEANLLRMPAGMALVFRTNSSQIAVRTHYLNYSMVRHSTTGGFPDRVRPLHPQGRRMAVCRVERSEE